MSEIKRLSDYGYSFQLKLIISLLTDSPFLQQIVDILETSYFESEANSFIIKTIKNYFFEYKLSPTMEVMIVKIKEIESELLRESVKSSLKESYTHIEDTDLEFIKKQSIDFCKNQKLRQAIVDSVELLEESDYDGIKVKIDQALKSGVDRDIGHNYKQNVEERYNEEARMAVKTGWPPLDELLDGGLAAGELGIIAGGPGSGKSWLLAAIGATALKQGIKVIHYTLELSDVWVGRRYDSILTGLPIQNLKFHVDEIKEKVEKLKSDLIIKYYPSKTASLITLAAHVDKSILMEHKPGLIIVDYPDILKYSSTAVKDMREDQILGNIYVELRGLGGQYNCPVWAASQFNRSAAQEEIIQGDKIAGSYEKLMHADFVMSWSRKVDDKLAGTARGHLIKNRFGPDGLTLPSKFNGSNGKIELFEPNTIEGRGAQKDMDNSSELVRKHLSQRRKELFSEEEEKQE